MNQNLVTHEAFENAVFERAFENKCSPIQNKMVVLVGGASASGKGFLTEKLQDSLKAKGIKPFVLCLDDFYKGISLTITGKANKNFFENKLNEEKVANTLRDVIEDSDFTQKFSQANCLALLNQFGLEFGKEKALQLVNALKTEFERINFDEPDSVNLLEASKVVRAFYERKDFTYPICGMDFKKGEHKHTPHSILKGQDYDVLIVEGLYALNEALLSKLDHKDMTKLFIQTDFKTMLVRRLSRDILQGRSSMSGEGNLRFMLEVVLPAFNKHILPTQKNANFVVQNELSKTESYLKPKTEIQEKIVIQPKQVATITKKLNALGFLQKPTVMQEDWFFESSLNKSPDLTNLLRLRIQNGVVETCLYKGNPIYLSDGKIVRPTEVFLTQESFVHYKNKKEDLLLLFHHAGLHPFATVEKQRTIFESKDGLCRVNLDKVNGLGTILEISSNQNYGMLDNLKKELAIEQLPKAKGYLEEVLARKQEVIKIESELKFVLGKLPNFAWTEIKQIEQTYLDLSSLRVQEVLAKLLPFANLNGAKEARVRVENGGEACFVTLKNAQHVSRNETEKPIPHNLAIALHGLPSLGTISKTRHIAKLHDDLVIEVDQYHNSDLIVAEVEFDVMRHSQQEVEALVLSRVGKAKNVTMDPSFKNANLAKNFNL